nr:hypothetical protein CFP56_39031 [Quercus suber]
MYTDSINLFVVRYRRLAGFSLRLRWINKWHREMEGVTTGLEAMSTHPGPRPKSFSEDAQQKDQVVLILYVVNFYTFLAA